MLNKLSQIKEFNLKDFLNNHFIRKDSDFKGRNLYYLAASFYEMGKMKLLVDFGYDPSIKIEIDNKKTGLINFSKSFFSTEQIQNLKTFHEGLLDQHVADKNVVPRLRMK